tara:strand:+ start:1692 stop:2048 length:357 start_codon:yes stop_codon:yes gene_type:complete
MTEHTYDRTWESTDENDNVIGSADLRFHFTFMPGSEGDWNNPPEGPEIEVFKVEQDIGLGYRLVMDYVRPGGEKRSDIWIEWARDELYDEMIQSVADDSEPDGDYAYESARDRMMEND